MNGPIGVWISLTKGYAALVDRRDEPLSHFKWSASVRVSKNGNVRVYGVREVPGTRERLLLHCVIFGECAQDVDHADGDTLNCRRFNLREDSRSMNNANSTKRKGSSVFKGVHWHAQVKKWTCQVKKKHYGLFKDEVDAATVYNFIAFEQYGEFARFNTPQMNRRDPTIRGVPGALSEFGVE
jgi:hypothetical protein